MCEFVASYVVDSLMRCVGANALFSAPPVSETGVNMTSMYHDNGPHCDSMLG